MKPNSLEDLVEVVRSSDSLTIRGSGSKQAYLLPVIDGTEIDMTGISGIINFEPDDRVVEVFAGTPIVELQAELRTKGQCLPLLGTDDFGALLAGMPGTIGGLIAMNLPHGLRAQCGGPKEWVLGAKVMRSNGDIVKSGGKVVKNVAGFDFHRFIVGARGTIGIVSSVFLKVVPIPSVPAPSCIRVRDCSPSDPVSIQRVLPSDYAIAFEAVKDRLFAYDPASMTLWYAQNGQENRYASNWLVRANSGKDNLEAFDLMTQRLFAKAKAMIDPDNRFNRGALGCI